MIVTVVYLIKYTEDFCMIEVSMHDQPGEYLNLILGLMLGEVCFFGLFDGSQRQGVVKLNTKTQQAKFR